MATFEDVREFIGETCRVSAESLTPSTRLLHDLGIDGDDAVEILTGLADVSAWICRHCPFNNILVPSSEPEFAGWSGKVHGGDTIQFTAITLQDLTDTANRDR